MAKTKEKKDAASEGASTTAASQANHDRVTDDQSFDAKTIQKKAAEKGEVIKLRDRMHLIIQEDSGFYKKGQKISPHRIYGQALVDSGIAKPYDKRAEKEKEIAERKKREEGK